MHSRNIYLCLDCFKSFFLFIYFHCDSISNICSLPDEEWQKPIRYQTIHFLDCVKHLRSVTETVSKSLFVCVNRDPNGYDFRAGERDIRSGLKKQQQQQQQKTKNFQRKAFSFFLQKEKARSKQQENFF